MGLLVDVAYPTSTTYEVIGDSIVEFTYLNAVTQGLEDYNTSLFKATFISDSNVVLLWEGSTKDIVDPTYDEQIDQCVKICLGVGDGSGCFETDINSGIYPGDNGGNNVSIEEFEQQLDSKLLFSFDLQGRKVNYISGQMNGQIIIHKFENGTTLKRYEP